MISSEWKSIHDMVGAMTLRQQQWLTDPGSLTKRLRLLHPEKMVQQVQREAWELPTLEEAQRLQVTPHEAAYIRETQWRYKNEIWVATRVIIPRTSLQGKTKDLQYVGSRSLGELLFSDPDLKRSAFEIQKNANDQWARRSLFFYYDQPLLVMEIFFPVVFFV